eukprot:1622946-Amphidinium_carterae.1
MLKQTANLHMQPCGVALTINTIHSTNSTASEDIDKHFNGIFWGRGDSVFVFQGAQRVQSQISCRGWRSSGGGGERGGGHRGSQPACGYVETSVHGLKTQWSCGLKVCYVVESISGAALVIRQRLKVTKSDPNQTKLSVWRTLQVLSL